MKDILGAAAWLAAGYAIARALEARSLRVPLRLAFRPDLTLLVPVNRLVELVNAAPPAAAPAYDPEAPLPLSFN